MVFACCTTYASLLCATVESVKVLGARTQDWTLLVHAEKIRSDD